MRAASIRTPTRTFARLASVAAPLTVTLLAAGCASQSPDPPAALTGATSDTLSASSASTASFAVDQMKRGGAYMFSLDESDPSTMIHARCDKEGGGDAAKAAACCAQIKNEGDHEGMRFSVDAQQRIVWTSFGRDNGQEAILLEGPLSLATDGPRRVVGHFADVPHGTQMEGKTNIPKKPIVFDFVDDKTMVMTDEIKGRLVFHPSAQ